MSAQHPPTDEDHPVPDPLDVADDVTEEEIAAVRSRLATEPRPVMPADVVARLQAVLRAESERRAAGTLGLVNRSAKPPLDQPSLRPAGTRWLRFAGFGLAAAVFAALVGFAGYVVSASAGLNEPVASAPAQLNSRELAERAREIVERRDLDPHRFSQAWQCARRVTSGRITGLTPAVVDGSPALLVYTRSGGRTHVTVVTGCPAPSPSVGPSAVLPR